jgi:hypothetical protein
MQLHKITLSFLLLTSTYIFAQTEPAANPTNFRVRNLRHWQADIAFTRSIADSFLVFRSEGSLSGLPVDGTIYQKGQWLGNGKVVSIGRADSFFVRELVENTTFTYTVFAYNRTGNNTNYKQSNPLIGTLTTPTMNAYGYYQGLNPSVPNFLSQLTLLINNHSFVSYESYKFNIVPAIWERDTIGGNVTSECAYSGVKTVYPYPITFGSGAGLYSKEHCLPRSWMLTGGNTNNNDGADFFNLLVTEYNSANFKRSNLPYGIVVNPTFTFGNFKIGKDANNITVAEPRNEFKGHVARNMMNQMVSYNGQSGNWGFDNLTGLALQQNEALLKTWNSTYPPSKQERTKNEYIYSIQYNRNPFIDNPSWVDCINFKNITSKSCVSGINELENELLDFRWKDATSASVNLSFDGQESTKSIFLSDLMGKVVYQQNVLHSNGVKTIDIPMSNLPSGVYILTVQTPSGQASVKIPYFNQ